MAPNAFNASLNRLIELLIHRKDEPESQTGFVAANALRKKLQSIIFFPPESEPSWRETRARWNGVLERRRIDNQGLAAEELERCDRELEELVKSSEDQKLKSLDNIRAFLIALHSPPSHSLYQVALRLREQREGFDNLPSQAELDAELYRNIIESDPLVGDHWQTDIYAGSSSSDLSSAPTSDSAYSSDDDVGKLSAFSYNLLTRSRISKPFTKAQPSRPQSTQDNHQCTNSLSSSYDRLDALKDNAYWLKNVDDLATSQLIELTAFREVLAALSDIGGHHIYMTHTTPNVSVTLSLHAPTLLNKSRAASVSLFSSFIPILSSLKKLRIKSQMSSNPRKLVTRVEEAFAASLLVILHRFDSFLSSIELRLLGFPSTYNFSETNDPKALPVFSLMRLYNDLVSGGWNELFFALAPIIPDSPIELNIEPNAFSTKELVDKLYDLACRFDMHHDSPTAAEDIKTIFLQSCQPLWMWIGDWILHGRLPDRAFKSEGFQAPDDNVPIDSFSASSHIPSVSSYPTPIKPENDETEFFIQANSPSSMWTSSGWWQTGYLLRTTLGPGNEEKDLVPKFLQDFKFKIIEGGKARALSQLLGLWEGPCDSTWPQLFELMQPNNNKDVFPNNGNGLKPHHTLRSHLFHPATSSQFSKLDESELAAKALRSQSFFHHNLSSRIDHHLSAIVDLNHSRLHEQFSHPFKLSSYLNALNDFFLFGSISSGLFVKKIFGDMEDCSNLNILADSSPKTTAWWDDQAINVNLLKAFEQSPSPIMLSCLPSIRISPSIRHQTDPIKSLEAIYIQLTIPTPLNYVVDDANVVAKYNRAFIFLAQLAHSARILDSLILIKPIFPFVSCSSGKHFEKQSESKAFYRLKNRLNWFINLMTDYCMNLVILRWKSQLAKELEVKVTDVTQKIMEVRWSLDRLMELLFLSDQCHLIHRAILQLFQLCASCHKVWTAFNRQTNTFAFIPEGEESGIFLERKRRTDDRRRRRIQKEQYTLIDEASRNGIENQDPVDFPGSSRIEGEENGNETSNLTQLASFSVDPAELINQGSFLVQLQRMNEEFEKLLPLIQRGLGKLFRAVTREGGFYWMNGLPEPPFVQTFSK
ncbi:hypothetical protein O181_018580 [Austropuccinia psidii MF-1]|uniref:Spindle pole body component n=1 Tax=Austropuccinia psidii MF-1 TaxID=1389203 RepID=A0A9Q3C901_9BASI|nr:hypothetical protein [Austropuccinia psidii MF-1]